MSSYEEVGRSGPSCALCRYRKRTVSLDCDPLLAIFLGDSVPVRSSEIVVEV